MLIFQDLLVKNIKRHLRQARRGGSDLQALDFLPTTYILPQDYSLFVEEFRKQESATWIMKPSGRAQGQGIFLINKLSQALPLPSKLFFVAPYGRQTFTMLHAAGSGCRTNATKPYTLVGWIRKWAPGQWQTMLKGPIETYVVSRYIDNPLLIGGKKFDLRLYVVVLSYKPLKAYLCKLGFARFCNIKYTAANSAEADISNPYVHLTNVSIQRRGEEYNESHGNKWPLSCLLAWLQVMLAYQVGSNGWRVQIKQHPPMSFL
ncbi:hypothetical protein WJX84_010345 [Apatococcus fuscideae]|uniref:Uncharacterized protein n=1 Tax=Apatococcus fuscideae TaxID=2026836 RepID=A0AAW1RTZ4_9CHLO